MQDTKALYWYRKPERLCVFLAFLLMLLSTQI